MNVSTKAVGLLAARDNSLSLSLSLALSPPLGGCQNIPSAADTVQKSPEGGVCEEERSVSVNMWSLLAKRCMCEQEMRGRKIVCVCVFSCVGPSTIYRRAERKEWACACVSLSLLLLFGKTDITYTVQLTVFLENSDITNSYDSPSHC